MSLVIVSILIRSISSPDGGVAVDDEEAGDTLGLPKDAKVWMQFDA